MIVPLIPPPPPQHPSLRKDNSMIDEKKLIAAIEAYAKDKTAKGCWYDRLWGLRMAIEIINQQPKVGEWIPCSKELPHFSPEKQRSVLVTMEDSDGMRFVTSAKYQEERCEWCNFKDPRYYNFEVIAWQLKPEPWKGKTDE